MVTFSLLTLTPGSHLTSAVEFFVFEAPKVLMLLADDPSPPDGAALEERPAEHRIRSLPSNLSGRVPG
jgi:hypothetical protein